MTMHSSVAPDHNGGLQRYYLVLQACLGPAACAGFELGETAGHVFAYSRAEGVIYVLLKQEAGQLRAHRFSFVSTALALSDHFGKLVVPSQKSLRAVFADGKPPDRVAAYRFAVDDGRFAQAP
jgi:hypothetical protein